MDQKTFLGLLQSAVKHKASDIHLTAGLLPCIRFKGELVNLNTAVLTDADMIHMLQWIISEPSVKEHLDTIKDYDCSFEIKNFCRFRINVFRKSGQLAIIMRLIPITIPTLTDLGLAPIIGKIALSSRGLICVTGITGSGKSTTLSAMIDHLNKNRPIHIITIEDPIEFLHTSQKARISQREIGKDTDSFVFGLRSALRQDPDVILIGEMRDAVTIDIAMKAAETGHMVFTTVHTTDASKTIARLVAMFPAEEQHMARLRLAETLVATISQRLIKRADGKGLIAAQEIMINNIGIAECIADPALTGQINDFIIKSNGPEGGQTFDQHLTQLYHSKMISLEEAKSAASNANDFERNLKFGIQKNTSLDAKTNEEGLNADSSEQVDLDI